MAKQDLKEKIYEFLKNNIGQRFSLIEIAKQSKVSYPSVLKYIPLLIIESENKKRSPPIRMQNHGHIKLVWIEA